MLEICVDENYGVMFDTVTKGRLGHVTVLERYNPEDDSIFIHNPNHPCGLTGNDGPNVVVNVDDDLGDWITVVAKKKEKDENEYETCTGCGHQIKYSMKCPYCKKEVKILPIDVLGCMRKECANRNWDEILCYNERCLKKIKEFGFRTITSPEQGEQLQFNAINDYMIQWLNSGDPEEQVEIKLIQYNDQGENIHEWSNLTADTNPGEYQLQELNENLIPGNYCIKISSTPNGNCEPESKKFSIVQN
ncbi:hypothetical protein ES703_60815 [subsurface metagenome]